MPNVPPAAIDPVDRLSAWPKRRIDGVATLEIVAAMASDHPQTAPNPPQAAMVPMANPPRRCPTKALAASYSSCAIWLRWMKAPISTNSGMTVSP